ncbi:hypothetical protein CPLU01_07894 [Colletotrichum plurivorum]|uniref:2EXR domain-containing protein n=1 Tax=Colletotrichum plurivorum TaxID=2175906 RepID=A0A8H6NE23_9PEZI|nr:hypothetical protein CPLU01_07894 [Colletotrichum plurivorum]
MAETKGSVTDQMDGDILPASSNADRTFHRFPDLPAEIRRMIWREFYLEPRTFHTQLCDWQVYYDTVDDDNDDQIILFGNETAEYMYKMAPALPGMQSYYDSIDTSIDRTSADVARTVRPHFWLPPWVSRDGEWIGVMPSRDPANGTRRPMRALPNEARVNWDADWTTVTDDYNIFHTGGWDANILVSPQTEWWANIRNLVFYYEPSLRLAESRFVTQSNVDLWICCRKMPLLEQVRAIFRPWPWLYEVATGPLYRIYELCEALSHFQRRYLLRKKSCADAHMWKVKVDFVLPPQMAELTWDRVWSLMSRAAFMTEFKAELRDLGVLRESRYGWLRFILNHVEDLASKFERVDLHEKEQKGLKQLFRRLDLAPIQAVMKGLDKWVEYDSQHGH